jgi:HK97 family phage major capsid protein
MEVKEIAEIKALAENQSELIKSNKELKSWVEKANGEISANGKLATETKAAIEKVAEQCNDLVEKCLKLEKQIKAGIEEQSGYRGETVDLGKMFSESDEFKAMAAGRSKFARIEVKASILNATGQNQPLVQDQRLPGIVANPDRALTIRDLMPAGRTTSNLIQYTRENVFTNSAAIQATEGATKAESGITFTLANAPVVTIAHWIPVSRQVLDDAPQLQSYVNGRLMYGLKLEEEDQLLNGDGTSGNISGLLDAGNFVAYNRTTAGDTKIDVLRRSITQAQLSNYSVTGFVMNPADWEEIELTKATDGHYILANPVSMAGPQLWGRRIVPTNSIPEGTFLTGAFTMGAQVWDRQEAAVQISYEDGDNFKKNMATLLAEERLALTVYRPAAFVSGTF